MKKHLIGAVAIIVAAFFSFSVLMSAREIINQASNNHIDMRKTVIIDAGHGGFDGGAVAEDGTPEKDINLQIAKNLRDFLELFNFHVVMTRTEDISTETSENPNNKKVSDLRNRLALMSKYDDAIFVSVHLNKFTSTSVSGAQTFYSQNADGSEKLAQSIHGKIISMLQPENIREIKKGTKSIFLLRNATCPAVIVECGFLSNKSELEKLKDEKYQRMMAFCIFCGIIDYNNGLRL